MAILRIGLALLAAALLALPAAALAQDSANVRGTISLPQPTTLPSNSVVTVQLADATQSGAPARVISEQTFSASGTQPTLAFTVPYNISQIATNRVYIVQGNIKVGGQLRYTTTTPYRVITQGSPTTVAITMRSLALPSTSGPSTMPLVALLLATLLVGLRLLRPRLLGALR